jgi:mRNA interferase MazF
MNLIYQQFETVVVPFPFTDSTAIKRRPALIISDATVFNTSLDRSVMAMITTAAHSPWALDTPIRDLQQAGLTAPSIVRMKLFTLDHRFILKRLGILAAADQFSVEQALKQLLNV